MFMKRFLIVTLLLTFAATSLFAQHNPHQKPETKPEAKPDTAKTETKPILPTVDQILDKYEILTGGKIRGSKITSIVTKGVFEIPAMSIKGTVEIYAKAPNKMFTVQNIPGFGVITDGYDGQIAWTQDPSSGLRQKKGEELAQTKRLADFTGNVRTHYSKFELKGMEKVADKDAYIVIATPNEGKPETWFFDTQSGLLLRSDMTIISPMGEIPVKMFFEDYREFEGMLVPYTTRQVATAFTAVIKIEEVKTNVAIDDTKFVIPKVQ